ncbi:MAG: tRNA (mo5U34)-methyltransferase [Solirubrobacterales bacterium]|nr:tRNA (mo5U34)-methyltransferase [Solirubrobacterales bacterium]
MNVAEKLPERLWYHVIELGDGTVTPGWFDLRPYVHHYGLPDDMSGMRALEVGTWDGFWAFEMERRGAEVVALDLDRESDLDWPPRRRPAEWSTEMRGDGFRLLKERRGSKVERVDMSIYHATPEELGSFDLVFCGSVLLHLRDQLLALERIANLCGGTFISAEEYDRPSGLVPFPVSRYLADREKAVVFWLPSIRTWRRMMRTAGFERVERRAKFVMKTNDGIKIPHVVHHAHKS